MSNVAKVLFYILSNDAQVGPVVSNGEDTPTYRIHPLTAYLQEEPPFITTQIITGTPEKSKQIASVDSYRVQVNIIDETHDAAHSLAAKVRAALDFKSGIFAGVNMQYCALETTQDIYEDGNNLNGGVMIVQEYLIRLVN
jgi:hypothetical protein